MNTILLVEDNPDDEALTLRALKKNNLANDVTVMRDGAEAIAWLDTHQKKLPHIVPLDLKLPKADGIGVLRHIRSSPKMRLLPVVMLTSSLEEKDLVESYTLGANSYVRKPVDFFQFTDAVRQLGLCWLVLNQRAPSGT